LMVNAEVTTVCFDAADAIPIESGSSPEDI
jgi:hypothetical protein